MDVLMKAFEDSFDQLGAILMVFVGIGLALFVGVVVAILYYWLCLLILENQYQQKKLAAKQVGQEVLNEATRGFRATDVSRIVNGNNPRSGRKQTVGEIVFGTRVDRPPL
jgi:hypothetical protein